MDYPFNMVYFNGSLRVRVIEGADLKPTDLLTRNPIGPRLMTLDPYVAVDVDEVEVGRTAIKPKTLSPKWGEEMCSEVVNGQMLGLTVYHSSSLPPDGYVANASIAFDQLKPDLDTWVCTLYYD